MYKTPSVAEDKITPKWYVIDATGQTLGRLASKVAFKLRGKDKPYFTPHVNCGDYVVVINASKIKVSGNKSEQKIYYRHTGYPGGLKEPKYDEVFAKDPRRIIEHAVRGMLPKNPLGRAIYRKLKVYADDFHPHTAQKPLPFCASTTSTTN